MAFCFFISFCYIGYIFIRFLLKRKKDKRYTKVHEFNSEILIVLLIVLGLTFSLHVSFFRVWIEGEATEIFFADVGELTIFQPTLFNDNYTRFVNFSLRNTYLPPYDFTADLEFNVKFSDLKHNHSVVDFYPDYNILYEKNTPYEIFYRWSGLKSGEITYLNFSIDWNKEIGGMDYIPIDFSSSGTCIKLGHYRDFIYISFITQFEQ